MHFFEKRLLVHTRLKKQTNLSGLRRLLKHLGTQSWGTAVMTCRDQKHERRRLQSVKVVEDVSAGFCVCRTALTSRCLQGPLGHFTRRRERETSQLEEICLIRITFSTISTMRQWRPGELHFLCVCS